MASKKEKIKEFYEDNGWRATISEFKISPSNLSKIVKGDKAKASKKADATEGEVTEEKPKAKKKGKKKSTKAKAKKTEAPANDAAAVINEVIAGLEKLKTVLAA